MAQFLNYLPQRSTNVSKFRKHPTSLGWFSKEEFKSYQKNERTKVRVKVQNSRLKE